MLTAALAWIVSAGMPALAQRPASLLLNGGFEWGDGGRSGTQPGVGRSWETVCGGPHPEIYSLDASVSHSGTCSQRMGSSGYHERWTEDGVYCFDVLAGSERRHPAPASLGLQAIAQSTRSGLIRAGQAYQCVAWVRTEGVSESWEWFRLGIYWLDDQGGFISESRQPQDPDGPGTRDWKQITVTAVAPERAASAKVYLHHHFVHGTVWFDDVRLTEKPRAAHPPDSQAQPALSGRGQ